MPNPSIRIWKLEADVMAMIRVSPVAPVTVAELREALAAQGVVEGILEEALAAVAAKPSEEEVLVARGVPPEHGVHAEVSYQFDAGNVPFKLLESASSGFGPGGKLAIELVQAGALLATKRPPTPGTPGKAVTGAIIPPVPGKDQFLLPGPGARLSEDRLQVIADIEGQPFRDREKVGIVPVRAVAGDVGIGQHLEFPGTLLIAGTVAEGAVLQSGADVEILGNLEGGAVEAAGRVRIWGGMRGEARVQAQGEVTAKFVESGSQIATEGDITVMENCLASQLVAKGKVSVGQSIIGGLTRSGRSITTYNAGTASETPTRLEIWPESSEENLASLAEEAGALENELNELNRMIQNILAKPDQGGSSALKPLTAQKLQLSAKLAKVRKDRERLEAEAASFKAEIAIAGKAYPGLTVQMGRDSLTLSETRENAAFTLAYGRMQLHRQGSAVTP